MRQSRRTIISVSLRMLLRQVHRLLRQPEASSQCSLETYYLIEVSDAVHYAAA